MSERGRIIITFLITSFFIALIWTWQPDLDESDRDIIAGFIEWFGLLYGILLALMVVEVWSNFSTVEREIDKEADELFLLYRTANILNNLELKDNITIGVKEYANYILSDSGKQTRLSGSEKIDSTAKKLLNKLHHTCGIAINTTNQYSIASELLKRINRIQDTRGDRVAHANENIPLGLYLLLIFTSLVWLIPFLFLNIENVLIWLLIVGGVSYTITFLVLLIWDLDNPYKGQMQVSFESFNELAEDLRNYENG